MATQSPSTQDYGRCFYSLGVYFFHDFPISAVIADERKYWHKMPNDAEFTTLETVYDVLKPLSTLTDALAGEK